MSPTFWFAAAALLFAALLWWGARHDHTPDDTRPLWPDAPDDTQGEL